MERKYFIETNFICESSKNNLKEWEEKFNNESNQSETFKKKYYTLKDQVQQHQFMNHARSSAQRIAQKEQKGMNSVFSADTSDGLCSGSVARWSPKSNAKILDKDIGPNSVASFGSVLGHHARTLVGTLGCHAIGGGETKDRGRSGTPETTSSESSPPPSAVSSNSRRSSHLPSWNKGTSKIRGSSNEVRKMSLSEIHNFFVHHSEVNLTCLFCN